MEREIAEAKELKRRIAARLAGALESRRLSKGELARAMGTSRSALDRLLDPDQPGLTLKSLVRVARVLDLDVVVELTPGRGLRRGSARRPD